MRRICGVLLALSFLLTAGCAGYYAPVMPPSGILFSSVKAPMDTNADQTPVSMRSGESTSFCALFLFSFGDCSVNQAAMNGGLNRIDHVDYAYMNILGLYQSFTTIAYGE